jgi:plastocyanin
VTFLSGGPPKGITLDNIDAANVKSGVSYDGTGFIHSGFITPDPTSSFTIKFTKAGSYQFICMIHPGMAGTVTVIPAGGYVPTQAQIDSDGKAALASGLAAAQKLLAAPPAQATKAGNTWTIPSSPFAKLPNGFVAQNAFTPAKLSIGAGDSVTWVNDTPQAHTVTFTGNAPPAGDPTQPTTKVTSYSGGFASSGLIGTGGPPELFTGGSKYTLSFPTAGTYSYICILHADQGMAGVIEVGPAGSGGGAGAPAASGPAPSAPAQPFRPPATGDAGLAGFGSAAWPLALIVALLGLGSLAAIKARAQA